MQDKRLAHFQERRSNRFEKDLFVDLTIHDVSAILLEEFFDKVIRPSYQGRVGEAIKDLMRKALLEEAASTQ
ncbi:hypothetical protein MUP01_04035 [Candidatus Bathyarchaeota archaeon]|nr:hypothetical protein [Candidatus Bathyarchaeota archaeon]